MAEREHRQQRRHLAGVAEVVAELALRERGACGRLGREEPRPGLAAEPVCHERVREACEVRTAAHAADHDVGLLAGHLHLLLCFLPNDRLVQQHVVEDRSERVVRVLVRGGDLDRLADRDPKGPRRVGMLVQDSLANAGGR